MRNRSAVRTIISADWTERGQDLLLISSFGAWALILGLLPVFAFRALLH
jgi:hypothetical protein